IEANAFLLHMVRNIASGLRQVGHGEQDSYLSDVLAAQNRNALGPTAPPQGLYLSCVRYPDFELPAAPVTPSILRSL
ncbi:MAG: tRNA pseudouridine(38-40) synthase TruA, partial [Pseudomonadota bacterium]|nr:tRNA pseudouridine(38-40) synthase TruA [Pseudomonadota bacterium]